MSLRQLSISRLLISLALLVPTFACQSGGTRAESHGESPRAQLSSVFTASATVTALDTATRRLTLRREDGLQVEFQVGPAVRNFDRIAVGDVLRVRYEESLSALRLPPGESIRAGEAAVAAGRAKPGEKPGAGMGAAVSVRVRIESIDRSHDIVVFSLASGELVAHRLQTPEGRAFVKELSIGDAVQLDYGQSLVLGIEEF